jgi:hypothetical protein
VAATLTLRLGPPKPFSSTCHGKTFRALPRPESLAPKAGALRALPHPALPSARRSLPQRQPGEALRALPRPALRLACFA